MTSTESKNFEKFDLSLGGHALSITSDQDRKKMNLIVKVANEKIEKSLSKNYSFQKSLMIALLQMCEENINLKSDLKSKLDDIEQNAEQILNKFQKLFSEA